MSITNKKVMKMPSIILLPIEYCSIKIVDITSQITFVKQIHCEGNYIGGKSNILKSTKIFFWSKDYSMNGFNSK